jgi:hypothetical protein
MAHFNASSKYQGGQMNTQSLNCETCGHYELHKMITSGQPYGYSGVVPCHTCELFSVTQNNHTAIRMKNVPTVGDIERIIYNNKTALEAAMEIYKIIIRKDTDE